MFYFEASKQLPNFHQFVFGKQACQVPVVYAYATTMRRAQGSTGDLVGLHFDRRCADRGYAYVGASRAKRRQDVFLVGRVRRSDWLPVGGDARGGEQERPGPESETDSDMPSSESFSPSMETSSDEHPSDGSDEEDLTAWNRFAPREPEDPTDEEDSDGSEFGFKFEAPAAESEEERDEADGNPWAALFE